MPPMSLAKIEVRKIPKAIENKASKILKVIYSDLAIQSLGKARYFLIFTDNKSRKFWIYFLQIKSQTFEKFKYFRNQVENQTNKKIGTIRSDCGGEYTSKAFKEFCKCLNSSLAYHCKYTPTKHHFRKKKIRLF